MPIKPFTYERPKGTSTQISSDQYTLDGCSDHQNKVIASMLNSDAPIVRLTGSPGTGKSFTTAALIHYFISHHTSVALTGTTHASVAVLSNMLPATHTSKIITSTIHSYLGMTLAKDNNGGEKLRKHKDAKPKPPVKYLIIDEVSMLTSELISHLKAAKITEKIILVGDAVQLNLPNSANLERYPSFELTINMRQDSTREDLTSLLSKLRGLIETNSKQLPALPESSANLTVYDNHCDFLKAYKTSEYSSKVVACYMNKTVKSYNTNVKKFIVNSDELYSIGDVIYPTSPVISNGVTIVPNRTICVIEDVMDCDEFYSLLTDKGVLDVPKGKTVFNNHLQALADESNWKEFYSTKERFTHVHHLYAGTAHSLQGTTVDEVFVDLPDLATMVSISGVNSYLRALYVAISRASKRVHIYTGRTRVYKCLGDYTPRTHK